MSRNKVLVTDPFFMRREVVEGEILRQIEAMAELRYEIPHSDTEMLDYVKDINAIMLSDFRLTKEIIEAAHELRIIARIGIGYNNVDLAAASKKRILVTNVPGALSDAVADHAILLMLAVTRRLVVADRSVRNGKWEEFFKQMPSPELMNKTLGIIGFGSIGGAVAQRAKAFGMKVMAFDPYVTKKRFEEYQVQQAEFEQLLKEADVVTVHTPLTRETTSLIGKRELGLMKESAILINTARGEVVDEQCLVDALKNRTIAAAGLDVLAMEPPDAANPLFWLDNVILTPHSAGFTLEACRRLWFACADAVMRVLRGELPQPPANIVNKEVLPLLEPSS